MGKYDLARAISQKRFERNLSLTKASELIGISYVTLWRLENGYTKITYSTCSKLANFLEISEKEVRDLC